MSVAVHAVDRPEVPPFVMPDRFVHEITYFMAIPGEGDVPELPPGHYWIRRSDAQRWLDEGSFSLVSPLDSASRTEIELTEEQEDWLQWLVTHDVEHVRLER